MGWSIVDAEALDAGQNVDRLRWIAPDNLFANSFQHTAVQDATAVVGNNQSRPRRAEAPSIRLDIVADNSQSPGLPGGAPGYYKSNRNWQDSIKQKRFQRLRKLFSVVGSQ